VPARTVIFRQGDSGDALYIIARGVVRISRRDGNDSRHVATLMAGNFFGEAALLENRPRNATVTAITPCSLYRLKRKDLDVLIDVYSNIRHALEQENERRKIQGVDHSGVKDAVAKRLA
jgi:CRP-like cAMP-binding protein